MNPKVYVDWGKLVQVAIIIAATVALGIAGVLDKSAVALVIGSASGYVFGNGKSAREGSAPAPLLGRRNTPEPPDPEA